MSMSVLARQDIKLPSEETTLEEEKFMGQKLGIGSRILSPALLLGLKGVMSYIT
jgi:hypothetical protein